MSFCRFCGFVHGRTVSCGGIPIMDGQAPMVQPIACTGCTERDATIAEKDMELLADKAVFHQDAVEITRLVVVIAEKDATIARLRKALERNRQGYKNVLVFRKIFDGDRYGALTREEIEEVITGIDAALADTPQSKQDGTA